MFVRSSVHSLFCHSVEILAVLDSHIHNFWHLVMKEQGAVAKRVSREGTLRAEPLSSLFGLSFITRICTARKGSACRVLDLLGHGRRHGLGQRCGICENLLQTHNLSQALTIGLSAKLPEFSSSPPPPPPPHPLCACYASWQTCERLGKPLQSAGGVLTQLIPSYYLFLLASLLFVNEARFNAVTRCRLIIYKF